MNGNNNGNTSFVGDLPAPYIHPPLEPVPLLPSSSNDPDIIDWTELAEVLEFGDEGSVSTGGFSNNSDNLGGAAGVGNDEGDSLTEDNSFAADKALSAGQEWWVHPVGTQMEQYINFPRDFITRTIRSEVIETILDAKGDVECPRFVSALDLLSQMFKQTVTCNDFSLLSPMLNANWKSISRPSYHYGGSLGMNERSENVYTLGKMTFNMFKPGNLRVTVQNTMNCIETVCRMDKAPSAAPWSLRRELALRGDQGSEDSPEQNPLLKSYDIVIALTIEPGQFAAGKGEVIPSPPRRLRATQIVNGYFLPDPDVPNRLSVWFTGGKLSFAPPSPSEAADPSFGTLKDWIDLFGSEHKRSWGEALSVMGAKLFLGAELPDGMEPDGSMAFTLHRPFGGHGKGYVDVLYIDNELLITKGNSGTLHAMIRTDGTSS